MGTPHGVMKSLSASSGEWMVIGEFSLLFPQHIDEGLLNSRRRVSDRPSWILIFKTPARKQTNVVIIVVIVFLFVPLTRIVIFRVWPGLGGSSTS